MAFRSLDQILEVVEKQVESSEQKLFRRLLQYWSDVVGEGVAKQTRPLSIQRQVLRVATSSAVWSQTLTLERRRILTKLNLLLPSPLSDIRFSTAEWQNRPNSSPSDGSKPQLTMEQGHPSRILEVPAIREAIAGGIAQTSPTPKPQNPQAAFQRWAEVMQARSQNLPLCPQCQCPAPPGELQRWSVCALCATKQWSETVSFPDSNLSQTKS